MTSRKQMRKKNELFQRQFEKDFKTFKPDKARGYIKQREKVKSWKVKVLKELNKPATPKPDKDFWIKKFFPNCEFKELPLQERVNKFWINKRRGV